MAFGILRQTMTRKLRADTTAERRDRVQLWQLEPAAARDLDCLWLWGPRRRVASRRLNVQLLLLQGHVHVEHVEDLINVVFKKFYEPTPSTSNTSKKIFFDSSVRILEMF